MRRRDWPLSAASCAVTALLALLASYVPVDTFVGGDSGVKLTAVRTAVAHPARPLAIAPPVVAGVPLLSMMDPFFVPHDNHADAVTSVAFPLMTAPFYALFGLRGLYVLPLIGLLAALLALVAMARSLGWTHAGAAVFLLLLTLTPLLFYGLEFWEHTCAAALAYAGTAVFLRPARTTRGLLAAGILLGGAIVLRPEAICFVAALPIADRCLASSARPRELLVLFAGVAIAVAPLFAYNLAHFHSLTGLHLGRSVVALDANYLPSHLAIARVAVDRRRVSNRHHHRGHRRRTRAVAQHSAWRHVPACRRHRRGSRRRPGRSTRVHRRFDLERLSCGPARVLLSRRARRTACVGRACTRRHRARAGDDAE
ncbi:MAG TPA: hypothetical protein VHB78_08170 [Vicinamibacterales bacterium]|jgi:hypothetical protein|nr:hypothetical protein [Vicinamibacterales bacterium]